MGGLLRADMGFRGVGGRCGGMTSTLEVGGAMVVSGLRTYCILRSRCGAKYNTGTFLNAYP